MDEFDDFDDDLLSTISLDFPGQNEKRIQPQESKDSTSANSVPIPETFPFPFTPYDIQVFFMKELYRTLEFGRIGIFESPTGTGKSLSLICGALTWLKDYEEKQKQELELLLREESGKTKTSSPKKQSGSDPDWITAFSKKHEDNEKTKQLKAEQEKRLRREARLQEIRNNVRPVMKGKRKREAFENQFDELFKDASSELKQAFSKEMDSIKSEDSGCLDDDDDDAIVVTEYFSDDENKTKSDSESEDENDNDEQVTKIFYCSRTHSQLSQFVKEVQKSPFGEEIRVVSLGSRQNMCINDTVKKLNSLSLINDRCLELQKNKKEPKRKSGEKDQKRKKTSGGCPFYKQDPMLDYRDRVLAEVQDIEDLVTTGKKMKACPYYGTRYAIPAAQVVALPYNTLLHKSTREATGIKLKGNIVVVDEAHNLLETINNVYSVEVTGVQLTCAHSQLNQYLTRYQSRLKAKNLMYIRQILFILGSCIKYLGGKPGFPPDKQKIDKTEHKLQTINDFLFHTQMDNINFFKVLKYCQRSLISKKLHGFVEKYQPPLVAAESQEADKETSLSKFLKEISKKDDAKNTAKENTGMPEDPSETFPSLSSPLMHIEGFLEALTNADKNGRIVINKQGFLSLCSLKFLLLNPAVHFADIVKEARAVIVAGGTMQPISEFRDQLFISAGAPIERIVEYSCGHVIPSDQLLPIALAKGPSGIDLDFTYQSRDTADMLDELGRVVFNVSSAVPGGVVCFFPSYDYEKKVYAHWEKTGCLARIAGKKKIFREPKKANQVESILAQYSACITKPPSSCLTGSLLLCVVGGKMSEGINFSDDLGRCVLMVGLPYPNIKSPELKEKMDYLNANVPKAPDGKTAGQIHYENLCMKAVNQSIGRAIRHRNDYATILLLDSRYHRPATIAKLPGWISKHVQKMEKFGPAYAAIRKFFAEKSER